jgi:phosphoribosylformylglycinamidine synthase
MLGNNKVDTKLIPIIDFSDNELEDFLKNNGLALKLNEARKIVELLGRNPTLTELHIFNIEWSEHCSYKSSKEVLKMLPTNAPNIIQGPEEDAGIVEFTTVNREKYGIVIAHESHNHPSQVVPYEGAATGVGGILRDVLCMGAHIIATADPLRFGDPYGGNKNKVRYIANGVVDGIAGYGNPVGIPNLAGDVYFNKSFDENCLVNVVSLGIVKEKEVIHSKAPENADGYDIVIVGKATDNSGFGGAAFASLILDDNDERFNKGAVQVPDPFLKNVLIRATEAVFKEVRKQNIKVGFKDMGAGGIMCSSSELCSDSGYGAEIDLSKVHVSMNLPPFIIACSETQERFTWITPPNFTPTLLKIYNDDFELSRVSEGAKACVIGKVTKEQNYVLRYNGKIVCNVPIKAVTSGIKYNREKKQKKRDYKEPRLEQPKDYKRIILKILSHPNIASKVRIYKHYETEVQGNTVIRPGEADAGLIKPLTNSSAGVALSVDANPRYSRIDPYIGAINAVAESMRNIAAIGAIPSALTDCLNYGNPEDPYVFNDFYEGVKGISDAARNIYYYKTKHQVAVISGNVSFYNESKKGVAIDPSPIIACVGVINDYSKAITMKIKKKDSLLIMLGRRKDELGGSVYYELNNELGRNLPQIDFEKERNMIHAVIDIIDKRLALACHDISDGGLITTISEMILGGFGDGNIGVEINIDFSHLRADKELFSESSGFILETKQDNFEKIKSILKYYNLDLDWFVIGKTNDKAVLRIIKNNKDIVKIKINELKEAWVNGLLKALD